MGNTPDNNQLTDLSLLLPTSKSVLVGPFRFVFPIDNSLLRNQLEKVRREAAATTTTVATISSTAGVAPKKLLTISASESPTKQQGRTFSEVSVNFTRNPSDTAFSYVDIWFTGYQGNTNPVLMASSDTSPVIFLCETTGETVTVTAQPVGTSGATNKLSTQIHTTVALDGVVSAPPGPSVTQSLVATPLGYQFTFTQVVLGGGTQDVIDSYKVYRNTSNTTAGATVIRTYKHDLTNAGASIVAQDTAANGIVYYYWVSAVNTVGLESTKTAAQSGTVASSNPITGVGPQAVLSPTVITTLINDYDITGNTISSQTQGATVPLQGSFQFDVYTNGGGLDFFLAASGGTTGYAFRFDGRSGQSHLIFKVTGTAAHNYAILSTASVNTSAQSGWHHVDVRIFNTQYDLFVDGKWVCSATDATYTPTGTTYYGYFVAQTTIAPSAMIHKTSDHIPNGNSSWVPNANTAFAKGTSVVDAMVIRTTTTNVAGNTAAAPPCCFSWQAWTDGSQMTVFCPDAGGSNGYFFTTSGESGQHTGYIQKSGVGPIGTNYTPVLGVRTAGWHDCHAFISDTGLMNFYIDGKLAGTATDTTYIPTGAIFHTAAFAGGSVSKIGPPPDQKVGSTFLNGQGTSTGGSQTFTAATTTTTIKWTWPAFTLYANDGYAISVAANASGTTFSGLTASNTYYFGFYVIVATGVCVAVISDVSGGKAGFSASSQANTLSGDGNSVIAFNITAATPASGTGSGSGGGGTGGVGCFSGNTKLAYGCSIAEVKQGQLVLVEKANGLRVWRAVKKVQIHENYESFMFDMGREELVTPEHPIKQHGIWIRAENVFHDPQLWSGTVYNLEIDTEEEDEHNYVLDNGHVVHNMKIF